MTVSVRWRTGSRDGFWFSPAEFPTLGPEVLTIKSLSRQTEPGVGYVVKLIVHAANNNSTSVPTVCIFGYGIKTITGGKMQRQENGDDTVPQASGREKNARIHPVNQNHGTI